MFQRRNPIDAGNNSSPLAGRDVSPPGTLPAAETPEIEHNLQVYQIELEMQNEELRQSQDDLLASNARYLDLYNQVPVGLVVLDAAGLIQEANLATATLLGVSRVKLAGQALSRYIFHEDQDDYFRFRRQIVEPTPSCRVELRIVHCDMTPIWVQVDAVVFPDDQGRPTLRCMLRDVTERRQLEHSLQMKNQAFNAALSAKSIATPDGIITEANATFLRLWHIPHLEEVVGSPIAHFFMHRREAMAIMVALDEIGYWEGEFTARRGDGSSFLARALATVLRDSNGKMTGYQSSVMDVTERKQAELALEEWNQTLEARVAERTRELKDSVERFRQLADATFEGIAVADDGILLDGNQRFAEMHGYELAEMLGRPLSDFVAPQSRRAVAKGFSSTRPRNHRVFGLRKDGSVFPLETHMRVGPWLEHSVRIITLRDLTEIKATEGRMHSLRTDLVHAQRLALVSEVSAGIIHQLSQPLSCMGTNLSVLRKLKAAELEQCGAMEIFHDLEADAARMRDIVIHLRAIANPGQIARASGCLNALTKEVLPLLRARADHAQVHLKLDLCEHLPAIHADAIQLSQVIFNLMCNAIEASADVPLERRMVLVTTRPHAESGVELRVRDHGCGLSDDSIERLFTPFFSTKSTGMGVGLRLCQTIIQAHDGQIDGFNNADGIGATFRIELPVDSPLLMSPVSA